ncbi:MAG: hypothetical protein OXK21_07220 [Chloroflexota bacterium]|nr:hypothetical protein [Chloroflexota bacterium]
MNAADIERFFGPLGDPALAAEAAVDDPLMSLRKVEPESADRLALFAKLGGGWLDDESLPPTPRAIDTTARMLLVAHRLQGSRVANPYLAPTGAGSIHVGWKGDAGAELALVVPPEGTPIQFVMDLPDGSDSHTEWDGHIPADAALAEVLSKLA